MTGTRRGLSVRALLAGKHVLLTGVTGFLGKVVLGYLLETVPEIGRVTLVARGKRGKDARVRLRAAFERSPAFRPLRDAHGKRLGAFLAERIDVVNGDARKPLCGISPAELDALTPSVDIVLNVAGLTDFAPDPVDAIAVNVRGALGCADVAARTRHPRLLHVSTAFVSGAVSGPVDETFTLGVSPNGTEFDPEAELRSIDSVCAALARRHAEPADLRRARIEAGTARAGALGWPNLYTYSKGLAEHLLQARSDVRVTMVRPTIVECARTFPFAGWNEGLNTCGPLVWLSSTLHRRMPFSGEHLFDVVPVDSVVRGTILALALALADVAEPVYHLGTCDQNPITMRRALDLNAIYRRRQYARSDDPIERLVLRHLDSVIHDVRHEDNPVLPAARALTRAARDALVAFDPETHLPAGLRARFGTQLSRFAQKAGKSLGTTSRTLGQVAEMLRLYQPFVFDHDPHFSLGNMRRAALLLSEAERALFALDTDTLDWRSYWLDVQIPGLDKWSLPLLSGQRPPDDPPFDLARDLLSVDTSQARAKVRERAPELTSGLYGEREPGEAE